MKQTSACGDEMLEDGGARMKARLRDDLIAAMKDYRRLEAAVIRELIAAIDNSEAPSVVEQERDPFHCDFISGSAEMERLALDAQQVRDVILSEITKREQAAAEFERVRQSDRAQLLREEILVARRYIVELSRAG